MSDEEQSADNKNFLARWSQRKHEAKQPDHDAPTANSDVPSGPVAESDVAQEFDLSSLPKLEDMTATTDITAFLRKGVPEHLRNAALRKSWALDRRSNLRCRPSPPEMRQPAIPRNPSSRMQYINRSLNCRLTP